MQKKIIALAVAGLVSGAAFAQSNVTVYGIADMYYGHGSATGMKGQTVINSGGLSGSRLGFKGTEDLGNGNKALFVLEYAVGMDTNTGFLDSSSNQARQQLVGLTGNWGTAVAGYAQTAGYDWHALTSPVAGTGLDAAGRLGAKTLLYAGYAARAGNAVAYISPSFSGLTVAVNHARLTESTNTAATGSDAYANLISGTYANGPIGFSAIYSKISMANTTASDNVVEWGLTGSYDLGVAKLFASYQKQDNKAVDGKDSKWSISAAAPVGAAGTFVASYGANSIDDETVKVNNDSKAWTLAYLHGLSKRTTAYVGYTRVSNDDAATKYTLVTPTAGGSSSLFAAGLRHTF